MVSLTDEDGIKAALLDVRADAQPNDWAAIVFTSNTAAELLGTGSGGLAELLPQVSDDKVIYALIRKTEVIDVSTTVKFVFVKYVGDNAPRMLRARLGTYSGQMKELFEPYHTDLDADDKEEITDEAIENLIGFASGSKVHVLDAETMAEREAAAAASAAAAAAAKEEALAAAAAAAQEQDGEGAAEGGEAAAPAAAKPAPTRSGGSNLIPGAAAATSSSIKFADEDAVRGALADVRNDSTDTTWCVVGYEGKKGNTLELLGSGTGGYSDLEGLLEDDMVGYALVRKTELIDNNETVKFAHIAFTGDNINRMHRARLGTYQGDVRDLFSPFHVNIETDDKAELSDDIIETAIAKASGRHSHILD